MREDLDVKRDLDAGNVDLEEEFGTEKGTLE